MEKKVLIARGTDSAKVIQVIETRANKGAGTSDDLLRQVIQYWDFEGKLLAEYDPITASFEREGY